jgi:hypothetical protein
MKCAELTFQCRAPDVTRIANKEGGWVESNHLACKASSAGHSKMLPQGRHLPPFLTLGFPPAFPGEQAARLL